MSYQALYRKWRPGTFDDVIGQEAVMTTLKNQIKSGRIGHAYLFCGTRGTGKTSAAKIMARAVNCPCAAEHNGNPCNVCDICTGISTGSSMNVFEIDAASNNGVDNIREIRDEVEYPPVTGRFKVYIIDEVHMLSAGAFNALLKTLEEPPAYVIFILATTDPQKLPATILSRCQRYDFRRMSRSLISGHLSGIISREGMEAEPRALSYIAEAADGSMRDALSILDQCAAYHYGKKLTYDDVLDILGTADTEVFSRLYRQIIEKKPEEAIYIVNDLMNSGSDVLQIINDFIWYLRNVLLAGSIRPGSEDILDISAERFEQARQDAALAKREDLIRIIAAFSELSSRARYAPRKRVLLEVELLGLCTAGDNYDRKNETECLSGSAAPKETDRALRSSRVKEHSAGTAAASIPDNPAGSGRGTADAERNTEKPHPVPYSREDPGRKAAADSNRGSTYEILREHWTELVGKLAPSNRPLFSGALLKKEAGSTVILFRNNMNFKIASNNIEENGVLRLRELAAELTGERVNLMARVARPGEIEALEDRVTDEELSRINFHIDIVD